MEGIGIGSEGIEENLKENGFKVFVIDAKNTNTKTKIRKALEDWQNEKLAVLIGTDLALNNLTENHKIDHFMNSWIKDKTVEKLRDKYFNKEM